MAACTLCKKGVREQFVARSNGSEYVRCSNRGCGHFAPSRICRKIDVRTQHVACV